MGMARALSSMPRVLRGARPLTHFGSRRPEPQRAPDGIDRYVPHRPASVCREMLLKATGQKSPLLDRRGALAALYAKFHTIVNVGKPARPTVSYFAQ